jgi:hypothetical protein
VIDDLLISCGFVALVLHRADIEELLVAVYSGHTSSLGPDLMSGLAWLGLVLVAHHRGVTKEKKTLWNLSKS